ncbi:MAG TPA: type II secretion system protein [Opitutaceae bacterium]
MATGERSGFTLVEVLLVIALIALVGWIFIGGSAALLSDKGATPDELFWKAVTAARKEALEEQKSVILTYDQKARAFEIGDGASTRSIPVSGPDDLVIDFHPPPSDTSAAFLVGGTLVETEPMAAVTFYADGTCTAFRAQMRVPGAAHILNVDPWTCAPVLSASDDAR